MPENKAVLMLLDKRKVPKQIKLLKKVYGKQTGRCSFEKSIQVTYRSNRLIWTDFGCAYKSEMLSFQ